VGSCRLFRLEPSRAVLSGVRAAELRPVPPKSAWFVCKWFAPRQAKEDGLAPESPWRPFWFAWAAYNPDTAIYEMG
jgi:hypothetical protein